MQQFAFMPLAAALLFTLSASAAFAQNTLEVTPDGDVAWGDSCPGDPESVTFADLFIAIDCAQSGDTISLSAGTFSVDPENYDPQPDNVIALDRNLTITGAGADDTVVDGEDSGAFPQLLVTDGVQSAPDVVLRDLEFSGLATISVSAPALGADAGHLLIEDVRLSAFNIVLSTAVLGATGSGQVEVRGSELVDNLLGGGQSDDSSLVTAEDDATMVVRDTVLHGNGSAGNTRRIVLAFGNGQVDLENTSISANNADTIVETLSPGSLIRLNYVTIAGNFTEAAGDEVLEADGDISMHAVLIAEPDVPDCGGTDINIVSEGRNISSVEAGGVANHCEDVLDQFTDSTDEPALTLPPADTGGGVISVPLQADTPARAGSFKCNYLNGDAMTEDVRGFPRELDGICTRGAWQYLPVHGIRQVAFAPSNPDVMYAATLGDGVYRSSDGGDNWESTATLDSAGAMASDLVVHPDDDQRLLAAVYGSGVAVSDDGGAFWQFINDGLSGEALHIHSLRINPDDPNVIFAGTNDGLYRSTDFGETWSPIGDGLPE